MVVADRCSCMLELSRIALSGAYKNAVQIKKTHRNARFILKYVNRKLLPIAKDSGMDTKELDTWKSDFDAL